MKKQSEYISQLTQQSGLTKHFQRMQQSYNRQINLAIYMDLQQIHKLNIMQIINTDSKQNVIINMYGFRMNLSIESINKLFKLYIRQLDPILRQQSLKKYTILLFYSSQSNKNSLDILKQFYKKLPAVYYYKLNKIYVIQPTFMIKSFGFINFTSWARLFQKYVEFIQRIQDVQNISELKSYNILAKCPKQITKHIKIVNETSRNIQLNGQRQQKPKPFDCLKKQFYQYPYDQSRKVPLLLSILIQSMKNDKKCCQIEGIFRSAASIQDQQQILKYAYNLKTFRLLDSQQYCKRAISGIIKKIFTFSITPLIPYSIYNQILNKKIQQHQTICLWKHIFSQLPQINKQILCYVIQFLRQFILINYNNNKMNSYNLSVVFTPCFFRSKQTCLEDLLNSGKFAALVKCLLEKYDIIVGIKKQQNQKDQHNDERESYNYCCLLENNKEKYQEKQNDQQNKNYSLS